MKNKGALSILTQERRWEKYLFIIVSIITLVLGVLILSGVLDLKSEFKIDKNIFSAILIVVSVIGLIYGIYGLVKDLRYNKSVYYKIKKDLDDNSLVKNIKKNDLFEKNIEVNQTKNNIKISTMGQNGIFILTISRESIFMDFEYKDEYYDLLSEAEQDAVDDMFIELDPFAVDDTEVYKTFAKMINDNSNL